MKIERKIIEALRSITPKKDCRYYLTGLRIEPTDGGAYVTATDGHILARVRVILDEPLQAPVFVPNGELKKINKRGDDVEITLKDGILSVTDGTVTSITKEEVWRDLDIARVIPSETSGNNAAFNPELLSRIALCAKALGAVTVRLCTNGEGGALVRCTFEEGQKIDADMVIMPMREK